MQTYSSVNFHKNKNVLDPEEENLHTLHTIHTLDTAQTTKTHTAHNAHIPMTGCAGQGSGDRLCLHRLAHRLRLLEGRPGGVQCTSVLHKLHTGQV